jgi:hypothetical protein
LGIVGLLAYNLTLKQKGDDGLIEYLFALPNRSRVIANSHLQHYELSWEPQLAWFEGYCWQLECKNHCEGSLTLKREVARLLALIHFPRCR